MSDNLSVLIIGCGDIASGFDENVGTGPILSHAGAFKSDGRFKIVACVEPNAERRAKFMATWDVEEGYHDLMSCLNKRNHFDVVSICAPTEHHCSLLDILIKAQVRCIFAEKPLTDNSERSKAIIKSFKKAGTSIAVNYLRRWGGWLGELREELHSGEWGNLQGVGGLYAKGLLNCGSHFFDLVHYLIGPLEPRTILGRIDDGRVKDPTLSVFLETEFGAPVNLIGTNANTFFPFEVSLVMDKGQLSLENLGFELRKRRVVSHSVYRHQQTLGCGDWQATGLDSAMINAVNNIYEHLTLDVPLASNDSNALYAEELCAKILAMTKG
ncbi:MAG: dehydrogenase [Magnetovibrio sp.]|nr:dehydrogenase [Magnetovibrio sp.]